MNSYGDVMPFSEVTALQSRVKTELRAERLANGESPAYRRLSQLNGALQSDIEQAVAGKMQQQAQAVARGEMSEADTIAANMARKVYEWQNGRQALTADQRGYPGLEGLPQAEVLPFLAHAEQQARQQGDFLMVRAILDYRDHLASSPTSTEPPQSA